MKTKKQTKTKPQECPIEELFSLIGNKWKVLILRDLLEGPRRFGALKQATGASQKSLTSKLREMEDAGLVERKVFAEVPPRVEYTLTDIGYSLAPVLDAMAQWGTDYQAYCELKNRIDEKKCFGNIELDT